MLRLLRVPPMLAERKLDQTHATSGEAVQLWPITVTTVKATNLKVRTIGSVGLGYLHLSAHPWLMGKKKWRALR